MLGKVPPGRHLIQPSQLPCGMLGCQADYPHLVSGAQGQKLLNTQSQNMAELGSELAPGVEFASLPTSSSGLQWLLVTPLLCPSSLWSMAAQPVVASSRAGQGLIHLVPGLSLARHIVGVPLTLVK